LYYYLEGTFDGCEVSHISRSSNEEADNLENIGSQCLPVPPGVFWEEIIERSIKETKSSGSSKQKHHTTVGPAAETEAVEDTPEPEEIMMVEVHATIFGIHVKQNTTRRCARGMKDSSTVQTLCGSRKEIVQEKHIRHFAKVCYPPRRTSHTARHPRESLWSSCQKQSHSSQSLLHRVLLVNNCRGCKGHHQTM
jgi:hypothetical protein